MNAEEADSDEMPWPIAGDKLFAPDTDWWHNACLNFASNKWDAYATGYKEAADIIVERVVDTHRGMDTLIYPVAFLYRHYLELRLKELIISGQELVDAPADLKHVHRIDILWSSTRQLLERIWPTGSKTDLGVVGECINEFCQLDLQSMSFRYPVTKDGKPSLPAVKHINLRHLAEVMGRIASLLDSASIGISAYLDEKHTAGDNYQ